MTIPFLLSCAHTHNFLNKSNVPGELVICSHIVSYRRWLSLLLLLLCSVCPQRRAAKSNKKKPLRKRCSALPFPALLSSAHRDRPNDRVSCAVLLLPESSRSRINYTNFRYPCFASSELSRHSSSISSINGGEAMGGLATSSSTCLT